MCPVNDLPERERFCGYCGERLPDLGEGEFGACPRCRRTFGERRVRRRPPPPPRDEEARIGPRAAAWGPPPRDPVFAALLAAVLPGAGQVYNLQFLKGIFVFLTCWLVVPYFLGILDAYLTAERSRRVWQTVAVRRS